MEETFNHVIRLVGDEKIRLMMADAKYDLSDVKRAIEVVGSSKTTKGAGKFKSDA